MKKFVALTLALSLGAVASPVVADPVKKADRGLASTESRGPVKMTDEQMDAVTAGQLIEIGDITVSENLNNLSVGVNAAAAVAAALLGNAAAGAVAVQDNRPFQLFVPNP